MPWANLFPSHRTCWNWQKRIDNPSHLVSLMTCPNKVLHKTVFFKAWIIRRQSPSKITSNKLNFLARTTTLLAANASANSTKEVWSNCWLKAAMTFLEESLNTTPIPAQSESSKRVASKLPLKHVLGGGDQQIGARWTGFLASYLWTSQNSWTNTKAFSPISWRCQEG